MTIGTFKRMTPSMMTRGDERRICESLEQGIIAARGDWQKWFAGNQRARLEFRGDFENFHAWLRSEARQGKAHRRDEWDAHAADAADRIMPVA